MWVIGAVGVTLSYRFLVFAVCLKLRLVTSLRGVGVMRNLAEHFPHFKVKTAGFHFSCGLVCAWWCHLLAWLRISKLRWNHTQLAVLKKKKYCFDILMINLSQILLRFWTFSGFPCCVTTCLFYPCQAVQQHSRLLRSSLWSVSAQLTLVS